LLAVVDYAPLRPGCVIKPIFICRPIQYISLEHRRVYIQFSLYRFCVVSSSCWRTHTPTQAYLRRYALKSFNIIRR